MDRGIWQATVHEVEESDTTERFSARIHTHTHTHIHTHTHHPTPSIQPPGGEWVEKAREEAMQDCRWLG